MNTKPKFTVSCCVGAVTRAVLQNPLFLAVFFYEGIWFQNFLCLDMLDLIIMLPPARTLLTQWRPLKNLKGKQREFNVRGVIGVFQSRYYCDDFSVSELSVEDAVSVF